MMQILTPSPLPKDHGDFPVRLNPGAAGRHPFAVIILDDLGETRIFIETTGDADRLIRAACEAKGLLIAAMSWCTATDTAGGITWYCELPALHPGDHTAPGTEETDPDHPWPQDTPRGGHPYPDEPDADACAACGHLATSHDPGNDHPCNLCDCMAFRWLPQPEPEEHARQPVSFIAPGRPVLAGNPDGAT